MTSLPPKSQPRRRETTSEASSSSPHSPPRQTSDESPSSLPNDSHTVLLDPSSSKDTNAPSPTQVSAAIEAPVLAEEEPPDKCWICFNDKTEDTPSSSEWRSPCPCALIAHEACLLDWIADLEAPTSRNRAGGDREIKCPQCKADIHLARPRDLIVEGVRGLERLTNYALIPTGAVVVGSSVLTVTTAHGISSIRAVFDAADARRILAPLAIQPATWHESGQLLREHWRLIYGLPLIPTLLVLSRTTIADPILPAIPLAVYAVSAWSENITDLVREWPPSAGLSFAVLPYIRSAYNMYWNLTWRKWERKWLNEIKPRSSLSEEEQGEEDVREVDDGVGFGIELDIIQEEIPAEEFEIQELPAEPAPPAQQAQEGNADEAEPVAAAAAAQDARDAGAQVGEAGNQEQQVRMHQQLDVNLAPFVSSIMGALLFPHVAGWAGDLLKLALPRSLTAIPEVRMMGTLQLGKPTRFLQTRWGRSIVGGCLAVALKDMVMLYVRWKMAVNHRHRRVLNYDRKLKKVVDSKA